MRLIYFFLLPFLACFTAAAQSSLAFTIKQLPLLQADAGKDTAVVMGSTVKIGGTAAASGGSGTYTYSWAPTTGLDRADIANPTATVNAAITYTLSVDDGRGCKKTASVNLKITAATAIDPISTALGLKLFPNPARSRLFLTTDRPVPAATLLLELFDVAGKKVYTTTLKGNRLLDHSLSLAPYLKGLYILKLTGNNFNSTFKVFVY